MSTVVVTVYIEAKSKEIRDELLKVIDNIIALARKEDGVLRYVVGLPIDKSNQTSIYLIEEYETEIIRQGHLASEQVKALLAHLGPNSPSIAASPEIYVLPPSISYQRTSLRNFADASLLVLAFFGYQPSRTGHAMESWKAVVKNYETNEPHVLAYTVLEDVTGNSIRTFGVYADAEFPSTTPVEQNSVDLDGRESAVKLKAVAGFFERE